MLSPNSSIIDALNSDFARIFGEPPKHFFIEVIPTVAAQSQENHQETQEQTLGDLFAAALEEVETDQDIAEAERHYRDLDEANGLDDEAFDLTHEELRVYHFPDGVEVEVENPHTLTILADGTHQITPCDRVGVEIPPRWIKVEIFPKQGEACFDGHPPVNEIA